MVSEFNIKSFGFNVIPDRKQATNTAKTVENAIGAIWEPVLDYLKTNENVFSGDVGAEIQRLNMQTMQLGTIVNGNKEIRNIDIQS
ncbi:MAG: hypothetical protein OSJ27_01055 [Candidatus Gastranaerophilales bacterium]|nr:hypothetical protein [Candidatus Gastranaerophilales bacterium]